ncbi:hypothetical protein Hanom_Chr13g01194731 [Helianthus anomalus]
MIKRAQWIGPLYFRRSGLSPFCCCSLIFTTCRFHDEIFTINKITFIFIFIFSFISIC